MAEKPAYEALEKQIQSLERSLAVHQQVQARLRKIFDHTQDAILIHDTQGTIVDVNDKMCRMYGLTRQEALGATVRSVSGPGMSMETARDNWEKVLNGQHLLFEWEAVQPITRTVFPVEVALQCLRLNGESVVLANVRNITDRKQIEQALENERGKLSRILEGNPHGIAMIDQAGRYLYINRFFTRITGYRQSDIPTKEVWFEKAYPDEGYRDQVKAVWHQDLKSRGMGESREFTIQCKNGASKQIEFRSTFLGDQTITVLTDVTHARQAEQDLRESQARLKAIFMANPDPVAVYGADGAPLYLNPAFTEVFGWRLDELMNQWQVFIPAEERARTRSMVQQVYKTGHPIRFETQRCNRNQGQVPVMLSVATIRDFHGIYNGLVANYRDITEQKKTEAHLRQAQKMEAIGTLAGGIAHDFNNILSGIFGYAQLAQMSLEDPVMAKKRIGQIVKGAQRASDLVQQILTFSRQTEYKKQAVKLYLIVKETIKFLRSSIPATIDIQENITSRASVMADPTQAHQVVMNLCTNAYQAMGNTGGILSVGLEDVRVTSEDLSGPNPCIPGDFIRLEVRDTGHGMDQKTMERIFDPYFTTKEPGTGTGLGMAVVDGIVKRLNGFIKIFSVEHKGSTFQVFWPVTQGRFGKNPKEGRSGSLGGRERIMLVDDEMEILEVSRAILESQGYRVTVFKDGREALAAFEKAPTAFDLIVTDMAMPGMTGKALAARVLEVRRDIPVILCTGYSEYCSKETAAALGICRYVQKPVTGPGLVALVRGELDKAALGRRDRGRDPVAAAAGPGEKVP